MSDSPYDAASVRAVVYPGRWADVAGAMYLASRASVFLVALAIVAGFVFSPPLLVRLVLFGGVIPGLAALAATWVFRSRLEPHGEGWMLRRKGVFRRDDGLKIEAAAIRMVSPWRWPWPGPGLSVHRLADDGGGRLDFQLEQPTTLIRKLAVEVPGENTLAAHPGVVYAEARARAGGSRWWHLLFKYGLFPLLPTFLIFRLHQFIMYGGLLAQYRLHGLQPYLSTLAYHWILALVYLVLWASLLRGIAAGACMISARYAPTSALVTRRWAERGVRVLYYGGVMALIVWRSVA